MINKHSYLAYTLPVDSCNGIRFIFKKTKKCCLQPYIKKKKKKFMFLFSLPILMFYRKKVLTHYIPVLLFNTPWGYRKATRGCNKLNRIRFSIVMKTYRHKYYNWYVYFFKRAMKLYFTHYLCAVIILFNKGLHKPVFSTDSFGKLVFLSFCSFLCFLHAVSNLM